MFYRMPHRFYALSFEYYALLKSLLLLLSIGSFGAVYGDDFENWSIEELIQYERNLKAKVENDTALIMHNSNAILAMDDSGHSQANCSTHDKINHGMQHASEILSYAAGGIGIAGPVAENYHNYVAHYRYRMSVPKSSYGWFAMDGLCNIFVIGHYIFDWLNGKDSYGSFTSNLAPSAMVASLDLLGLIALGLYHLRLRLNRDELTSLL